MPWGYFCLFYKNYLVYNIFDKTMHILIWNYVTVQSFMFIGASVSELRWLKRNNNNNNNKKMKN